MEITKITKFTDTLATLLLPNGYEIRDGRVYNVETNKFAVLYSSDYGAGWSTWAEFDGSQYCPPVVALLLAGVDTSVPLSTMHQIGEAIAEYYGEPYFNAAGLRHLEIEWVDRPYRITEYDGYESIEYQSESTWFY